MNDFFNRSIIALTFVSTLSFAEKSSDGHTELATAIKRAQLSDRPIFLQVSTTWCGWCKRLDKYLDSNLKVKSKLSEKYEFCKIKFTNESKAGVFQTLPRIPAFPHIFILDKDGGFIHSQYTGSLELKSSYDEGKFMKLLKDWEDCSLKMEKNRVVVSTKVSPTIKPKNLQDGIVCRYYEGHWKNVAGFKNAPVKTTEVVPQISTSKYSNQEFIGTNFKGYVYIKQAGTYHIRLSSNDGSRLKLSGKTVIDNDGLHTMVDKYISLQLTEGYYPIEVDYFRNGGKFGLIFTFQNSDKSASPVKLYHLKKRNR